MMWSTTEYYNPPPGAWQVKVIHSPSPEKLEEDIHDALAELHQLEGVMIHDINYGGFALGAYSAMIVYYDAVALDELEEALAEADEDDED